MPTSLQDAAAAFRDLTETRTRLIQEIAECEAHAEALLKQHNATNEAYSAAKKALLVAASGGLYQPGTST